MRIYVCVFVSMLGNECVWAMPPVCVCVRECMPMLSNDSHVLFVGVGE